MHYPLQLQTFTFEQQNILLYVPDLSEVQKVYEQRKVNNRQTPFPYWAHVWPAALAMAEFIHQHPHYIEDKSVLELAAGLGLPSLLAARKAQQVTCTDYIDEAVTVVQQSAEYNGLHNMHCHMLNWHRIPTHMQADVLLLSDVNYEPPEFEILYNLIERFIKSNTTILLSTPQRLMAKSFISRLLPWCTRQQQIAVPHSGKTVPITIMVLQ